MCGCFLSFVGDVWRSPLSIILKITECSCTNKKRCTEYVLKFSVGSSSVSYPTCSPLAYRSSTLQMNASPSPDGKAFSLTSPSPTSLTLESEDFCPYVYVFVLSIVGLRSAGVCGVCTCLRSTQPLLGSTPQQWAFVRFIAT